MSTKNSSLKLKHIFDTKNYIEIKQFIIDKILYIQDIIRNTILSIKHNKKYEVFSNNDTTISTNMLYDLYEKTNNITSECETLQPTQENQGKIIDQLQKVIDKLSMIICGFGTIYMNDLLFITFGTEYTDIKMPTPILQDKYHLIKKYIHPISYKTIQVKTSSSNHPPTHPQHLSICCDKTTESSLSTLIESANMFECFDVDYSLKSYYTKVY